MSRQRGNRRQRPRHNFFAHDVPLTRSSGELPASGTLLEDGNDCSTSLPPPFVRISALVPLISSPLSRPQACTARDDPGLTRITVPLSRRNNKAVMLHATIPAYARPRWGCILPEAVFRNSGSWERRRCYWRGVHTMCESWSYDLLFYCVSRLKDGGDRNEDTNTPGSRQQNKK